MENQSNTCVWDIILVTEESPNVKTLVLRAHGTRPKFIAGQYLTVYLKGIEPVEGKAYSIASSPKEETVRLTIKEMGAFSKTLLAHTSGNTLTTSLPYGFFYSNMEVPQDIAFVAGGIGITPCMSIIQSLVLSGYEKNIFLFYSNRTLADIVFKNRLDSLVRSTPLLKVIHYITRETPTDSRFKAERMTAASILEKLPCPKETDFFICGSIDFTKTMWKSLNDAGIQRSQLNTEGFF